MKLITYGEKWVQNGFVLSHFHQKPFFISGAVPGEYFEFTILKENKNFGFGLANRILEKSKIREESDCPIFLKCGGCNFRHIPYKEELNIKIELLKEFSELKDKIESQEYELFPSPTNSYRNQVKIHFDKNRKGFYQLFSNSIVELPEEGCRNLSEEFNNAIRSISIQDKKEEKFFFIKNQLYYENQIIKYPLKKNREWELSPKCFLQTNRFLIYEWLDWIRKQIQIYSKEKSLKIVEFFCGIGLISSFFIEKIQYYEGYELNSTAVDFAKKNFNKYKIQNQIFIKDLYKEKVIIKNDFDFIIVNPPRKGLGNLLIQTLSNQNIPIVYSSCNPATLNRDLKLLKKYGYKNLKLAVFDFFPRTFHLEIVVFLYK